MKSTLRSAGKCVSANDFGVAFDWFSDYVAGILLQNQTPNEEQRKNKASLD